MFTLPDLGIFNDMEAREVSRDIILLAGGLFLIGKSTYEMHEKLEHAKSEREGSRDRPGPVPSFAITISPSRHRHRLFADSSVITAIGMVEDLCDDRGDGAGDARDVVLRGADRDS